MSIVPLESAIRTVQPSLPDAQQTPQQVKTRLDALADTASLSNLAPRHRAVLDELTSSDSSLPEALSGNVERLQDAFVDELYTALADAGADLTAKLTLRMEGENLAVDGDHPQRDSINQALADRTDLGRAFAEIAVQSEVLRDVRNIGSVIAGRGAMAAYADAAAAGSGSSYQISLKGEMSHFYFGRGN